MKYLLSIVLMFAATLGHTRELPAPTGEVLLTISGNISVTNGDGVAQFDRALLEALAQRTTNTETPWFEGTRDFSGPLGHAILYAVGAQGDMLRVVALNDYAAEVPTIDFRRHPVILATHVDEQELTIRKKGPLFLIYPFDERPELFNEVYFGRSVWQIARIEVID